MLDDFDLDFPEDEEELEEEGGTPTNRTFIMIAGGLGGAIIIALVCIFVYSNFFGGDKAADTASQTETAVSQTQTGIANNNATNKAETETAEALIPTNTSTPSPTNTPTQGPTDTVDATVPGIPTVTVDLTGGPTADPRTATVQALLTQAAAAQTEAAKIELTASPTATALPDTGVKDDIIEKAIDPEDGGSGTNLLILTIILFVVIVAARQARKANA